VQPAQLVITLTPNPDGSTALSLGTPPGADREWILRVLTQTLAAVVAQPPTPPSPIEVATPDTARQLLAG